MKYNEFKRWLQKQGVVFAKSASGSHFKIRYGNKQTIFPNHGAKEINQRGITQRHYQTTWLD